MQEKWVTLPLINWRLVIKFVISFKFRQFFKQLTYKTITFLTSRYLLTNYEETIALYSKSQTVQKFNFDKTPTFSRIFHPNFFDNFSREIKVVNSSKVQNHNIFTSFSLQKIDNCLGKSKLNIWTKNEDFEQCALLSLTAIPNCVVQATVARRPRVYLKMHLGPTYIFVYSIAGLVLGLLRRWSCGQWRIPDWHWNCCSKVP